MKKGYQVIISLVVTAVLTVAVIMVETNEQKYVIRQDYITFAPFIFLMLITFALVVSIITIYISGKNVWQYIIAVVAAVIS